MKKLIMLIMVLSLVNASQSIPSALTIEQLMSVPEPDRTLIKNTIVSTIIVSMDTAKLACLGQGRQFKVMDDVNSFIDWIYDNDGFEKTKTANYAFIVHRMILEKYPCRR